MNPFHYGTPVDADHFAGRHEERRALTARMGDGINVVLSSPRRYGKTSLLLLAEDELRSAGGAIIHLNVLRCRDAADLAGKLAAEAFGIPTGRWHRAGHAAAEFVRRLRINPTVTFGADGVPRFGFDAAMTGRDAEAVISDVYALLGEARSRKPAVLVLDEFQAITDLDDHLPGVVKALADAHPQVSLVLAGSHAHLMERLTGSPGAPLYGMAERLALGPVAAEEMSDYLLKRAAHGGKPMTAPVAASVIERSGPVPNNIQRLAYAAFEVAVRRVTAGDVETGMARTAAHDAAAYAEVYQRLSGGQRRVLAAIAAGSEVGLYSAGFARSAGLATGASVRRAVDALGDHELVVQRDGRWRVADPFLATWLTHPDL